MVHTVSNAFLYRFLSWSLKPIGAAVSVFGDEWRIATVGGTETNRFAILSHIAPVPYLILTLWPITRVFT